MNQTLKEILADPEFKEGEAWFRHAFNAQDVLVKEGDNGNTLFVIEKGSLRVSGQVGLEQKKQLQAGFCDLKEGDIFGESCLHEIHRRTATVTAISEGCAWEIVGDKLSAYFEKHPEHGFLFYKKLFVILTERMNSANHRIENLLAWGLRAHDIERHL